MTKKTKKQELQEKVLQVKEKHPHLAEIDWGKILEKNPDVLGDVIGGIVRVEGQRRKVSRDASARRISKMYNEDYSENSFDRAFTVICKEDSLRTTAKKTGISYAHVYQLKTGNAKPTIEMMEKIAKAYQRDPSYFMEYRIHFVLESMSDFLSKNPEILVNWYSKATESIHFK